MVMISENPETRASWMAEKKRECKTVIQQSRNSVPHWPMDEDPTTTRKGCLANLSWPSRVHGGVRPIPSLPSRPIHPNCSRASGYTHSTKGIFSGTKMSKVSDGTT